MKDLKYFLHKEYPYSISSLSNIIFISLSASIFILLLQPFGFRDQNKIQFIASLGFGIITFSNLILHNYLIKKYIRTLTKKWTVLREIFNIVVLLFSISITNVIYFAIMTDGFRLPISGLLLISFLTVSISIYPIINRFNRRHEPAMTPKGIQYNTQEKEGLISLSSLNKTESDFLIAKNAILYLEATKNHVQIYYKNQGEVQCKSLRNTLTNLNGQINEKDIYKCHRSFMVNINNIKTAKGNSNGYKIHFIDHNQYVPVSRSYTKEFQKLIY